MLETKPDIPFAAWLRANWPGALTTRASARSISSGSARGRSPGKGSSNRQDRHEKDDRRRIDDRTQYVLGWTNEQKVEALIADAERIERAGAPLRSSIGQLRSERTVVLNLQGNLIALQPSDSWSRHRLGVGRQADRRPAETRPSASGASSDVLRTLSSEREKVQSKLKNRRDMTRLLNRQGALTGMKSAYERDHERLARLLDDAPAMEAAAPSFGELERSCPLPPGQSSTALDTLAEAEEATGGVLRSRRNRRHARSRPGSPARSKAICSDSAPRIRRRPPSSTTRSIQARSTAPARPSSQRRPAPLRGRVPALTTRERYPRDRRPRRSAQRPRANHPRAGRLDQQLACGRSTTTPAATSDYCPRPRRTPRSEPSEMTFGLAQATSPRAPKTTSTPRSGSSKSRRSSTASRAGRVPPTSDRAWTRRVTDVRQWFVFAASERWRETEEEHESYSDSSGKSGGQKEKLAYTILAASLAYQFKLEPRRSQQPGLPLRRRSTKRSAGDPTTRPAMRSGSSRSSGFNCSSSLLCRRSTSSSPTCPASASSTTSTATTPALQRLTIEEHRLRKAEMADATTSEHRTVVDDARRPHHDAASAMGPRPTYAPTPAANNGNPSPCRSRARSPTTSSGALLRSSPGSMASAGLLSAGAVESASRSNGGPSAAERSATTLSRLGSASISLDSSPNSWQRPPTSSASTRCSRHTTRAARRRRLGHATTRWRRSPTATSWPRLLTTACWIIDHDLVHLRPPPPRRPRSRHQVRRAPPQGPRSPARRSSSRSAGSTRRQATSLAGTAFGRGRVRQASAPLPRPRPPSTANRARAAHRRTGAASAPRNHRLRRREPGQLSRVPATCLTPLWCSAAASPSPRSSWSLARREGRRLLGRHRHAWLRDSGPLTRTRPGGPLDPHGPLDAARPPRSVHRRTQSPTSRRPSSSHRRRGRPLPRPGRGMLRTCCSTRAGAGALRAREGCSGGLAAGLGG